MLAGVCTTDFDVEGIAAIAGADDDWLTCKGTQGFEDGFAELLQGWDVLAWNCVVNVVGNSCSASFKSMRFGIRSTSVKNVNDVTTKLITSRRVIFTPNSDIKDELKKTSINITCYNKDGEIVKRVTSTDDADFEDPDNEPTNPNGGGNGSGTQTGGNTNRQYTISVTQNLSLTANFKEATQGGGTEPGGEDEDRPDYI